MENNYTLEPIDSEPGVFGLFKNDQPCVCPLKQPLAIPQRSQLTGEVTMTVTPFPCLSNCALFEQIGDQVYLNCSRRLAPVICKIEKP
jgi:hypothetical protein